ncbi:hypothetical protein LOC68_20330 [Blastopirellula sp. JC732]|uniref:Uncharacterized protein n=1 Tax=Blastopirellula sediminis TaxID=2894196 RepID=A0A9X1SLJ6_9BACT|nr:hypothetical protein [Blastopirellula sediminis]MCC9605952.1 hypothetical protein [Blastopirellula sediminis]MCC9630749.1 hypothetical protein [Blastopirellula sediminis]
MSLELRLSSRHWSCDPIETVDAATGKMVMERPHLPMTPSEQSAVKALLDEAAGQSIEEARGFVHLKDGGDFQVTCENYQPQYVEEFTLRVEHGLTPDLLDFLISILDAGNLILTSQRDGSSISLKEANFDDAPETVKPRAVCHSRDELKAILEHGIRDDQRLATKSVEI